MYFPQLHFHVMMSNDTGISTSLPSSTAVPVVLSVTDVAQPSDIHHDPNPPPDTIPTVLEELWDKAVKDYIAGTNLSRDSEQMAWLIGSCIGEAKVKTRTIEDVFASMQTSWGTFRRPDLDGNADTNTTVTDDPSTTKSAKITASALTSSTNTIPNNQASGSIEDRVLRLRRRVDKGTISFERMRKALEVVLAQVELLGSVVVVARNFFPPASVIWTSIVVLLKTAQSQTQVYDTISEQIVELEGLLSRLRTNLGGSPSHAPTVVPALREVYMRVLCEILRFFGVMTKYTRRRGFKIYASLLLKPDYELREIKDRLNSLVGAESAALATQLNVGLRKVDSHVNALGDSISRIEAATQSTHDASGRIEDSLARMQAEIEEGFRVFYGNSAALVTEVRRHTQEANTKSPLAVPPIKHLETWLSPPHDLTHELTLQQVKRSPNTCEWIFGKPAYHDWLEGDAAGVLWLYGRPGAGKSVLAANFLRELHRAGEAAVIWFFRYNNDNMQTLHALLRSVAYQVAERNPAACAALHALCLSGFNVQDAQVGTVWRKLFIETMLLIDLGHPLFLVVDALDECRLSSERLLFISLLADLQHAASSVKVIIFSRWARDIALRLRQLPIRIVEMSPDDNSGDIAMYASERLSSKMALTSRELLRLDILQTICNRADGTFLWVAKILDMIDEEDSVEGVRAVLDDLPTDMTAYFEHICASMGRMNRSQQEIARHILRWVIISARPLTLQELAAVVRPAFGEVIDMAVTVRNTCGDFISVHEGGVQANHMTVQEFLTSVELDNSFAVRVPAASESVTLFCIAYLSSSSFLDYAQADSNTPPQHLPFVDYSALYWAYHLGRSAPSPALLESLREFAQSKAILGWLMQISKCGKLDILLSTAYNIEKWLTGVNLKSNDMSTLRDLVVQFQRLAQIFGFPTAGNYKGDYVDDKHHGRGTAVMNGAVYTGEFEMDLPHGTGSITYPAGASYSGHWVYDEYNGEGTLIDTEGNKYTGNWKFRRRNGYGEMTWSWGERLNYKGHWREDRFHGFGVLKTSWGAVYEGEWNNGTQHGKGKFLDWNGDSFDGEWENGVIQGELERGVPISVERPEGYPRQWTIVFPGGARYEGQAEHSSPQGEGTLFTSTGVTWAGTFVDGRPHGVGMAKWPNGGYQKGTWEAGVAHGHFIEQNDDPLIWNKFEGEYVHGLREGEGVLERHLFRFVGMFKQQAKNGHGYWHDMREGELFRTHRGMFKDGYEDGYGVQEYRYGCRFEGMFSGMRKDSEGLLTFPDGSHFKGAFSHNRPLSGRFVFCRDRSSILGLME